MEVRQYYYTSYIHRQTGQAGFQIKAMSAGISPTLQATIARLIDYRLPSAFNVNALETHPVALRYSYTESGASIFLCSQSSGKDEYGRPGNFFAHVVVVDPDASPFTSTPPVFFWKSPFWRTGDPEEREAIVSLPVLPSFDVEPTLDVEDIWHFLAQGQRRAWLYKLMCAVIESGKTQRRIVIFDTDEHVALWIAAVSCLLPPAYRSLLTFSTYHHDPCQAPYLITGTATSSSLHAVLADSLAYFLLDATTGHAGPVEPSAYAELAAWAAEPDLYESQLLPIFSAYGRRFPRPTAIDEQLDLFAHYARIHHSHLSEMLTSQAQQAIRAVLPSFAALPQPCPEDINELSQIERHLRAIVKQSTQADSQATYQEVLALLKAQRGSIDDIVLEELKIFSEQFLLKQPQAGAPTNLAILCRRYGDQTVAAVVNSPSYLQWAAQLPHAIRANLECLLALTGGHMTPELVPQVCHALERLSGEEYVAMLEHCLPQFLLHDVSHGAHLSLVHALLPRGIELMSTGHFWRIYLNALSNLLQQPTTEDKAIKLLDFWFAISPHAFSQGYPVQQFFLLLPACELLQNGQFGPGKHVSRMELRPWYPSIRLAGAKPHNLFTTTGHTVMKYLHRYFPAQPSEMEKSGQRRPPITHILDIEVGKLFEEDKVIECHCRLMDLYEEFSAERFWPSYWRQFTRLLTTRNSDSILAAFTFWFERSFDVLESPSSYIPQEFFLGVSRALQSASRLRGFHDTMRDIHEKDQQVGTTYTDGTYSWLPLITSLSGWEQQ